MRLLLDFGDLDDDADDRSRSFPLGGLCAATRCGDTWRPRSRLPRPLCILQRNDEDCDDDDDDDPLPNVASMCSRDDPPNFMGPIVTIVADFGLIYLRTLVEWNTFCIPALQSLGSIIRTCRD